jgi:hypothetical protein
MYVRVQQSTIAFFFRFTFHYSPFMNRPIKKTACIIGMDAKGVMIHLNQAHLKGDKPLSFELDNHHVCWDQTELYCRSLSTRFYS